jgi:branched-chain amino acid transport system substrate-binding protein
VLQLKMRKRLFTLILLMISVSTIVIPDSHGKTRRAIKIGVIVPRTGVFAIEGLEIYHGIILAAEEVNQVGGVLGKRLCIISRDIGVDSKRALVALKNLVYRDRVDMIISGLAPAVNLATGEFTTKENILQVAIGPGFSRFREYKRLGKLGPLFFNSIGLADTMGTDLSKFVLEASNPKTVAFLTSDDPIFQDIEDSGTLTFKKASVNVLSTFVLEEKRFDFSSELQKINYLKPEVIVLNASTEHAEYLLRQGSSYGFKSKSGWYAPYIDSLSKAVSSRDSEGLSGLSLGVNPASYKIFSSRYRRRFVVETRTVLSAYAYDVTKMLALAIEKAKSTKPYRVSEALIHISETSVGVAGKIRFDQDGMQISQTYDNFMFQKGKLVHHEACPVPPWCNKVKY